MPADTASDPSPNGQRGLPRPLSAGLGLLATGAAGARELPGRLVGLPFQALSRVGPLREAVHSTYAALADRGQDVVSRLRGQPQEEATAAPEEVTAVLNPFELPEPLVEQVEEAVPGAMLTHAELPLEDYDHLTIGQLRARIRRLSAAELVQLRDYERAHADRLPVTLLLDNRITKLAEQAAEQPAEPAGSPAVTEPATDSPAATEPATEGTGADPGVDGDPADLGGVHV